MGKEEKESEEQENSKDEESEKELEEESEEDLEEIVEEDSKEVEEEEEIILREDMFLERGPIIFSKSTALERIAAIDNDADLEIAVSSSSKKEEDSREIDYLENKGGYTQEKKDYDSGTPEKTASSILTSNPERIDKDQLRIEQGIKETRVKFGMEGEVKKDDYIVKGTEEFTESTGFSPFKKEKREYKGKTL
jgi:hypothetical protein